HADRCGFRRRDRVPPQPRLAARDLSPLAQVTTDRNNVGRGTPRSRAMADTVALRRAAFRLVRTYKKRPESRGKVPVAPSPACALVPLSAPARGTPCSACVLVGPPLVDRTGPKPPHTDHEGAPKRVRTSAEARLSAHVCGWCSVSAQSGGRNRGGTWWTTAPS